MKKWESTALEVYFDVDGETKQKKVSVRNIISEPTEEGIKSLGETLGTLSPEGQMLNSSVIITKNRIL